MRTPLPKLSKTKKISLEPPRKKYLDHKKKRLIIDTSYVAQWAKWQKNQVKGRKSKNNEVERKDHKKMSNFLLWDYFANSFWLISFCTKKKFEPLPKKTFLFLERILKKAIWPSLIFSKKSRKMGHIALSALTTHHPPPTDFHGRAREGALWYPV